MRREGKVGPFIPYEVRAQTRPAQATTPAVARRRCRATIAVGARAKAYPLERRRLRPGENACVWATTSALERRRVPVEGVFFHKHPKLQRSGDDVCIWATTSAPVRRRVPHGRDVFSQTLQTSALRRRRLRLGDNICARATTGAAWEGCFFTNIPNFSAHATTSGSCFSNLGIFSCFGNPNKTFPLSVFENY